MNIICFIRYLNFNNRHIYNKQNRLQQTVKIIKPVFLRNFNNFNSNFVFTFEFQEFDFNIILTVIENLK